MSVFRKYPMSTFMASVYGWFLLAAVPAVVTSITDDRISSTEAVVVVALTALSLTGVAVSYRLFRRSERRRSARFQAMLDAPARPSRLTVWRPPADH